MYVAVRVLHSCAFIGHAVQSNKQDEELRFATTLGSFVETKKYS
jgi:hypothetical protein